MMGITKQLLQRELSASDLEIEERCDSIAVYRTITWKADSFDYEIGNQSGTHTFDAADEWRGVVIEADTAHFIADGEYSGTDAKEFSMSVPTDTNSDEFIDFIFIADQWLEAEINTKQDAIDAIAEVAA